MKSLLNILFEKLHRYVYDKNYKSTNSDFGLSTRYNSANKNNRLEKYNKIITSFYNLLCPYFKGWRESLVENYPNKAKYKRYN